MGAASDLFPRMPRTGRAEAVPGAWRAPDSGGGECVRRGRGGQRPERVDRRGAPRARRSACARGGGRGALSAAGSRPIRTRSTAWCATSARRCIPSAPRRPPSVRLDSIATASSGRIHRLRWRTHSTAPARQCSTVTSRRPRPHSAPTPRGGSAGSGDSHAAGMCSSIPSSGRSGRCHSGRSRPRASASAPSNRPRASCRASTAQPRRRCSWAWRPTLRSRSNGSGPAARRYSSVPRAWWSAGRSPGAARSASPTRLPRSCSRAGARSRPAPR